MIKKQHGWHFLLYVKDAMQDAQIRNLRAEIAELKEIIATITEESQATIEELNRQIEVLKLDPHSKTSEREKELNDKLFELKKAAAAETAKANTGVQKELSDLRCEVAELKNGIVAKEAENVKLTLENIELKKTIRSLEQRIEANCDIALQNKLTLQKHAKHLIQEEAKRQTEINRKADELVESYERVHAKVESFESAVQRMRGDCQKYKALTDRNERAVDYLAQTLSLISEVPNLTPPSARELVEDPEKLIQLASEVEAACRQDKLETSERLRDASRKLRQSLAKEHRRPISRPVAKVLVNLGAVMMEFNEQLTEDHRQTMLLLGESSM